MPTSAGSCATTGFVQIVQITTKTKALHFIAGTSILPVHEKNGEKSVVNVQRRTCRTRRFEAMGDLA
jgi:hypothetical protein